MAFPEDDIHVTSSGTATSVRAAIVQNIWTGSGIPSVGVDSVTTDVSYTSLLAHIPNIMRADRYSVTTTDGTHPDTVEPWLLNPQGKNDRLLIVGLGHSNSAVSGIDDVIKAGISRGNHVLVIPMPSGGTSGHDTLGGYHNAGTFHALRYWLDPAIKSINQVVSDHGITTITACSLSGGGWLSVMLAAIDTRIDVSIPVSGSLPLDVRETSGTDIDDYGDWEQRLTGLTYDGSNALDYLDLYLLGVSNGRKQVMIGNSADSCCFYDVTATYPGGRYTVFDDAVISAASGFGGDWSVEVVTNSSHTILPSVIVQHLVPQLGGVNSVVAA